MPNVAYTSSIAFFEKMAIILAHETIFLVNFA
jgi:hypothetical protein